MKRVRVRTGDITKLSVDAIVNAANATLLGGGGVDGAIHDAAGPDLYKYCLQLSEVAPGVRCPTGESRITPGFDLPAKHIIHTVGPVWEGGTHDESNLLASCYRTALDLAAENDVQSIAFPAISCGVFGYPIDQASANAVASVAERLKRHDSIREVILIGFDRSVYDAVSTALTEWRKSNA